MTVVPVIDISTLLAGDRDGPSARAIHEACLDTGFFAVVAHGLADEIDGAFTASRAFFGQPPDVKGRTPRVERYGYVARTGGERGAGGSGETEFLDLGLADEVPMPAIDGFERAVRTYQAAALDVGSRLLRVMAGGLGASPGYFAERMSRPQCRLRFLHYVPLPPDPSGVPRVPTRPHTDYGALTLLATDGVPGLEVLPIDGEWTPVAAPPGSLVVNIGDMLARWTNDVYRSTPHRVVAATDSHRYSIPFFVNPNPDTIIHCIPSCVTEERPCAYEPVRAADYLAARIDSPDEPYVDPATGSRRR